MSNIEFVFVKDQQEMGITVANRFDAFMRAAKAKPNIVLPTGNTPLPFYAELVRRYQEEGKGYLNNFIYQALDEHLDMEKNDPRSFKAWLGRALLDPLNLPDKCRNTFNCHAKDVQKEIVRMREILQNMGAIDLAVLGHGEDCHVGFNMPNSGGFDDGVREDYLSATTRQASRGYNADTKDLSFERGLTLGGGDLRKAKETWLLANKPEALRQIIQEPYSIARPASYLQQQPDTVIFATEDCRQALAM